jgi:DNA-directed RNA polymerase specialized sigma24 family protein
LFIFRRDDLRGNVKWVERGYGGLTMPEIAVVLGMSLATVERHWNFARTWLYAELKPDCE